MSGEMTDDSFEFVRSESLTGQDAGSSADDGEDEEELALTADEEDEELIEGIVLGSVVGEVVHENAGPPDDELEDEFEVEMAQLPAVKPRRGRGGRGGTPTIGAQSDPEPDGLLMPVGRDFLLGPANPGLEVAQRYAARSLVRGKPWKDIARKLGYAHSHSAITSLCHKPSVRDRWKEIFAYEYEKYLMHTEASATETLTALMESKENGYVRSRAADALLRHVGNVRRKQVELTGGRFGPNRNDPVDAETYDRLRRFLERSPAADEEQQAPDA